MERQIVVCIGTDEKKSVRARLSLLLVEGAEIVHRHYHSINISPGADLAAIRAINEAHIAKPGGGVPAAPWPAIPDDEWAKVEKCCAVIHTPEVLFAATAEVEAQIASIQQKRETLALEVAALDDELKAIFETRMAERAKSREAAQGG